MCSPLALRSASLDDLKTCYANGLKSGESSRRRIWCHQWQLR